MIYFLYILALLYSATNYFWDIKYLKGKEIAILCLLLTVLITEVPAIYIWFHLHKSNLIVYNASLPIQFLEIVVYLTFDHIGFKRNLVFGIITIAMIFYGLCIFSPFSDEVLNISFLLFEGLIITSLSLLSFYHFFIGDIQISAMLKSSTFWITILVYFFWCCTYFYWGFQGVLVKYYKFTFGWIYILFSAVDCLFYFGLGFIAHLKRKNVLTS
jgi:hypothetical protein